jgi:hypothetical protein
MRMIKIFTILSLLFYQTLYSQKADKISFGLNVTHFRDWKNKPFNFFNPEISYSKAISKNQFIYTGINGFYGEASSEDIKVTGDIFQRLIFTTDVGFEQSFNNFSAGIGPSVRYRNEKKVIYLPQSNPFDFLIDRKKGYFDFGGFANVKYEMPLNKKALFDIRLSYRIYSKGVNPISIGLFYSRRL